MGDSARGVTVETSDDEVLKPLVGWSYPFVMAENATEEHGGITKLGRALGGAFPLAANGLVHGGVHFDGGTAGLVRQ